MVAPVRLQLSRKRGFNLQKLSLATNGLPAVNVARPGTWGNPFVVGEEQTRRRLEPGGGQKWIRPQDATAAVRLFRRFTARGVNYRLEAYAALHGKNLACWCSLDQPCHADILLALANGDRR